MRRVLVLVAVAVAIIGTSQTFPALAQQRKVVTGIDQIHAQVRVGGKVCMASHEHTGFGTMPSRGGAEAAAVRHWQVFTADEYGNAWGDYGRAVAKRMSCTPSSQSWSCQTSAKPCRTGR